MILLGLRARIVGALVARGRSISRALLIERNAKDSRERSHCGNAGSSPGNGGPSDITWRSGPRTRGFPRADLCRFATEAIRTIDNSHGKIAKSTANNVIATVSRESVHDNDGFLFFFFFTTETICRVN